MVVAKLLLRAATLSNWQTSQIAYYINVEQFEEKGWRDHSASEATNAYASLAWKNVKGTGNIYYQNGDSDLTGNGASPVELLAINRAAIFTGPDVTSNNMQMFGGDFNFSPNEFKTVLAGIFSIAIIALTLSTGTVQNIRPAIFYPEELSSKG